jgi:hypothetical protein
MDMQVVAGHPGALATGDGTLLGDRSRPLEPGLSFKLGQLFPQLRELPLQIGRLSHGSAR